MEVITASTKPVRRMQRCCRWNAFYHLHMQAAAVAMDTDFPGLWPSRRFCGRAASPVTFTPEVRCTKCKPTRSDPPEGTSTPPGRHKSTQEKPHTHPTVHITYFHYYYFLLKCEETDSQFHKVWKLLSKVFRLKIKNSELNFNFEKKKPHQHF